MTNPVTELSIYSGHNRIKSGRFGRRFKEWNLKLWGYMSYFDIFKVYLNLKWNLSVLMCLNNTKQYKKARHLVFCLIPDAGKQGLEIKMTFVGQETVWQVLAGWLQGTNIERQERNKRQDSTGELDFSMDTRRVWHRMLLI